MPRRSIRSLINLVIACAMTVGMLLSAAHVVAGHNAFSLAAAEASRHGEAATIANDHGHSHDEDEGAEQPRGHVHGHNPSDHVHEPFALNAFMTPGLPDFSANTDRPRSETSDLDIKSLLKRPPRSIAG